MSDKRFTLDTNILVYAVDVSDAKRCHRAQEVIDAMLPRDCVLTLQSLSEFYFTVTRKRQTTNERVAAVVLAATEWSSILG